jgi:hypothetical protein
VETTWKMRGFHVERGKTWNPRNVGKQNVEPTVVSFGRDWGMPTMGANGKSNRKSGRFAFYCFDARSTFFPFPPSPLTHKNRLKSARKSRSSRILSYNFYFHSSQFYCLNFDPYLRIIRELRARITPATGTLKKFRDAFCFQRTEIYLNTGPNCRYGKSEILMWWKSFDQKSISYR